MGSPLTWSATGIYHPTQSSTTWTGTGSYAGQLWAMGGVSQWTSPTDFRVQDFISIDGQRIISSTNSLGIPIWNTGFFIDPVTHIT